MNFSTLDLALVAFSFFVLWRGWSRGLVVSLFSLVGVFVGGYTAHLVLGFLSDNHSLNGQVKLAVTTFALLACLSIGSAVGAFVGRRIRSIYKWTPLRFVDNAGGLVISTITWSTIIWALGITLQSAPSVIISQPINDSVVIAKLDEVMPTQIRTAVESLRTYISSSALPNGLVDVLVSPEVDAPDSGLAKDPNIVAALDSVVRVEGIASECNARVTGSGFFIDDSLVLTNAHVVAGVSDIVVRVKGKGLGHSGKVIGFDPQKDIALIRVADFTGKPLREGSELGRDKQAIVAGFPGGGHLTLVPSRVRSVSESVGTDIYGEKRVVRKIYALRANVRQGDSGGALISEKGEFTGVVFASSATDKQTGYALTPSEYDPFIKRFHAATKSVDTGKCLAE